LNLDDLPRNAELVVSHRIIETSEWDLEGVVSPVDIISDEELLTAIEL
jgi:hypothetical protein